jgi:hypothetical protein
MKDGQLREVIFEVSEDSKNGRDGKVDLKITAERKLFKIFQTL